MKRAKKKDSLTGNYANMVEYYHSKKNLYITVIFLLLCVVFFSHIIFESFGLFTTFWADPNVYARSVAIGGLVFVAYHVPKLIRYIEHRGPALTLDHGGITSLLNNGSARIAYADIKNVNIKVPIVLSLFQSRYGIIHIKAKDGENIKIIPQYFSLSDWRDMYETLRKALYPRFQEDLPPLKESGS